MSDVVEAHVQPTPRRTTRWNYAATLAATLVLTGTTLYLLQLYDFVHFTGRASILGQTPNLLYYHLRSSLVFFVLVLAVFALTLRSLRRQLGVYLEGELNQRDQARLWGRIAHLDARSDIAIAIFFGVGVIYTAIGMESALLTALGGIRDADDAARQGAWEILRRLVDGGLILALSTTIAGGIGGYVCRVIKHATVGRQLSDVIAAEERRADEALAEMADSLREIKMLLECREGGGST